MTQEYKDKFMLIEADVKEIKDNQSIMGDKLERLFEKATKPFLTTNEIIGLAITIITYGVIVALFMSDISAMAKSNKEKIEKEVSVSEVILEKVNTIAIDVAVVKNEQKKSNR